MAALNDDSFGDGEEAIELGGVEAVVLHVLFLMLLLMRLLVLLDAVFVQGLILGREAGREGGEEGGEVKERGKQGRIGEAMAMAIREGLQKGKKVRHGGALAGRSMEESFSERKNEE